MPDAIDLRDFPYMPLHIARLQRSKAWLMCKRDPSLAFYMLNLWMRAWHEVPAGSVEDDDDVLADAAMCDLKTWERIKEKALRGWERRNGRLFHPIVTELAEDANENKQKQRRRTTAATEARARNRNGQQNGQRDVERGEECNEERNGHRDDDRDDNATFTKGIEGKGIEDSVLRTAPQSVAKAPAPIELPSMRETLWRDGIPILCRLIGKSDSQSRSFLGRLLKSANDDCAKVYRVIREAESLRPSDPTAWLSAACSEHRSSQKPSREMDSLAGVIGIGTDPDDEATTPVTTIDHNPNPDAWRSGL